MKHATRHAMVRAIRDAMCERDRLEMRAIDALVAGAGCLLKSRQRRCRGRSRIRRRRERAS
jgi:hypothetical protein